MVVGLVGCGVWGANVLRDLRALECEVRVVARSEASAARAHAGGADSVVSTIPKLGSVDGIVAVTPIETHASVLREALGLGVPVFVEKPLCDDAAQAVRIAGEAEGQLFVMDKWRYHPGVAVLAEIARTSRLGRVVSLRTVRVQPDNRHETDCVWVLVPHDLAIAVEVLGALPRPVAAEGEWNGDRLVALRGRLETDGVSHELEVSEISPVNERRVELRCEEGVAVLGGAWDEHVTVDVPGREPERIGAAGELPLLAELRAFLGFLSGGPPPRSTASEGAAAVQVIAALRALAA